VKQNLLLPIVHLGQTDQEKRQIPEDRMPKSVEGMDVLQVLRSYTFLHPGILACPVLLQAR